MSELSTGYNPALVEDKWYAEWLKQGCFTADPSKAFNGHGLTEEQKSAKRKSGLKEAYSIVIPPPNVTGVLTMGHVLNNTIQDILCRRKRMQGFEVLWMPGMDHAGIATQAVVERQLRDEEKKTRHDFGREEFLKRVWSWKDKHGGIILQQLKKLGASCDWQRTVFTMDGLDARDPNPQINYSKWVSHVFVELYKKGQIYRGRRMVNWCVKTHTALSDEEVIPKETKGHFWHIRYPFADNDQKHLVVATTRPETMLGDTAVAVNPTDDRYKSLIGKKLKLPLTNREIPIIADELVDPKFGTGCVKVTPAHDPNDFIMGQRHKLEQIQVIGFNGKMTKEAGSSYEGLDRYACKEKVVADLQNLNLIEKIEDHIHNVGYSERADVPVEPMISEQWFLKYPAVPASLKAVVSKEMAFWPDRWSKVYEHWMGNIQDWCISRQIWWGHQIPAWMRNGEIHVGMEPPKGEGWTQDPDVLDTWFSSWLWPFATMVSDPEHLPKELQNSKSTLSVFYPTNDLVTGPDIIFFWVARMIMAGYEFMGKMPFENVYFTGIVRDKQGRKMSKSLKNSPDPLDFITKYGADALRFGTMRCAPLGMDIRFDEQQVELGRNFCNKLWNAARLRLSQTQSTTKISIQDLQAKDLSSDDKYILFKLDETIALIEQGFAGYEFNQITSKLYETFWTYYCDRYLEASKTVLYGTDERAKAITLAIMDHFFHVLLRLLHPFMPFITEELWQTFGFNKQNPSIQFAPWPTTFSDTDKKRLGFTPEVLKFVEFQYGSVTTVRNLRATYNISSGQKAPFFITPIKGWYEEEKDLNVLKTLINAESLTVTNSPPKGAASVVAPSGIFYLPLEGLIDLAAEKKRLTGQIEKFEKELQNVESKLADQGFVTRASPEAVAKHRTRSEELKTSIAKVKEQMQILGIQ